LLAGARAIVVQIGLRAITVAVQDVDDDELLLVPVRLGDHIAVGTEEIHPECAGWLPALRRHQAQQPSDQVPGGMVREHLDPAMQPGALDARSVRDHYGFVFFQPQTVVRPFVADDIPRALAVARPVAVVVPQVTLVEVGITEVWREFRRKPERLVGRKRISVTVQVIPQTREASGVSVARVIAHELLTNVVGWPPGRPGCFAKVTTGEAPAGLPKLSGIDYMCLRGQVHPGGQV
jgi:hypothetical protein